MSEIEWAAGFFEGDGTIGNGGISVPQVSREPLDRLMRATGEGRITGPHVRRTPDKYTRKDQFFWSVSGDAAGRALNLFAPYLGTRRREQARNRGWVLVGGRVRSSLPWAAGFVCAEGCFRAKGLSVQQTEIEPLNRLIRVLGAGGILGPYTWGGSVRTGDGYNRKPVFVYRTKVGESASVVAALLPYLTDEKAVAAQGVMSRLEVVAA